ncbi:RNA 2',3'-cyclic phosphodiesterase [Inmirania thermothiophila]|uniref:RNA 2',3'-cyclic phosphodiesterase n=1 Tax=Inmirania thermothiophila TaxID=1750597 RepID=A0A3N1XT84_9GAMM|nr:RNA 2',3'-cyclic phosphodiesterase [Inmirania thermothiophila]ROR29839.1 2'-5' RNA ligase [Inmirania thermothiophila]
MPSSPGTERLFLALWPDGAVREAVRRAAAEAVRAARGRPVPPDNLHLTLLFLGAVPPAVREALAARLAAVRCAPFELVLDRIGGFPRSRVAWIAPSRPPAALHRLVGQLRAAAEEAGLAPERRPFSPHLTLVRKARPVPAQVLARPVRWGVRRFWLVRSQTLPDGARYTPLRAWPLAAEAGAAPDPTPV